MRAVTASENGEFFSFKLVGGNNDFCYFSRLKVWWLKALCLFAIEFIIRALQSQINLHKPDDNSCGRFVGVERRRQST